MSFNDDTDRGFSPDNGQPARTSDLVRAVLERARANAPAAPPAPASKRTPAQPPAPEKKTLPERRPDSVSERPAISPTAAAGSRAAVSDAVSRVLNRYRQGELPTANEPTPPSTRYEDYAIPTEPAPSEYDRTPEPEVEETPPEPPKSKERKERKNKKNKKNKSSKNKKASGAPKSDRDSHGNSASELEASVAGLGALAGAVAASPAPVVDPDEFLSNVFFENSFANEVSLENLLLEPQEGEEGSTDAFLQRLSEEKEPVEEAASTQETIELLNNQSTLERAANDAPMWLISLIMHLALILILAFLFIKTDLSKTFEIVSEPGFSDSVVLDEVFDPEAMTEPVENVEFDATNIEVHTEVTADVPDISEYNEETAESLTTTDTELGLEAAVTADMDNLLGTLNGSDLSGRGKNKEAMLAIGGGSEGSEKSVALALSWLAEHQMPDGSWSFQMQLCPTCGGRCSKPGSKRAQNAATAIAILPFLAAGNTPTTGKYKKVVAAGMNWLTTHGRETEYGLSYHEGEGTMYSHGLATIALSETYAMLSSRERKKYRELGYIVENAIRYIENSQADNGGWRYNPRQAGDTSVFGWQMMALKSGQLAGINVNSNVVIGARNFLRDVVSSNYESRYGYTAPNDGTISTTAIGLLCRLYMDWDIETQNLKNGVDYLVNEVKPRLNDPYFMYYATQLMYNCGGDVWKKWNAVVRDGVTKSQCMEGHERGSWWPDNPGPHCDSGGRLFVTAMNCMILEVYYRHMPIYQKMERNMDFPIENSVVDAKK